MTSKSESETSTITMTDRAPITIRKDDWPLVADVDWHTGEHRVQANEVAYMRVREHRDGRRIVYGDRDRGNGGMHAGYRGKAAGFLVPAINQVEERGGFRAPEDGGALVSTWPDGPETIRAIRRVAGLLDLGELGNELIADLPAENLS